MKNTGVLVFLLFCAVSSHAQFYNGSQVTFGKNRVQYEDRFWSFYKFKNFDTYFYVGGKELAIFTGRSATKDLEDIEKLLDYKLDGRLQFVIYNKLSDAKQSNIGLESIDESQNNIGGVTKIVGNKIFLYFTGDHEKLHQQIRAGIAKVLIDQIMYGGSVKDRMQNSALLNLPDWYFNGLISYLSRRWDVDIDNRVRDGIITKKYLKINRLTGRDAVYAGHSIWKYIVDTYGETSISNLLYMTRINRNIESGFLFVIGSSVVTLSQSWQDYMLKRYADSDAGRSLPEASALVLKPKAKLIYNQLRISPDGRYAAYVTNDLGKYKVKLLEIPEKKTKRILKGGYRSYVQETDESFPLLAWHPSGKALALVRERKGKLWLGFYTPSEKKYEEGRLFNFEKVREMSYSADGQLLVFSAIQQGQSDIFIYNLRTRTYEQVTKDFYDDITPHFADNDRGIVFSSNRVNDTLEVDRRELLPAENNFDLFYYDYAGKNKLLRRITNTPFINETQPMPCDSSGIGFLSDENGIINRYVAIMDSAISFVDTVEHYRYFSKIYPQTNYARNILSHDINFRKQKLGQIFYSAGRYRMYIENIAPANTTSMTAPENTNYKNEALHESDVKKQPPVIKPEVPKEESVPEEFKPETPVDSNKIDINNYIFQSDFPTTKSKKKQKTEVPQVDVNKSLFITETKPATDTATAALPKQRNYDPAFTSDYVVTQLDNSMLNQTYQLFSGGGVYYNPGLNGFFKFGISDLLDDYKFTGGFRLSVDLNSNEYFLSYENLRRRLDKRLTFYRAGMDPSGFGITKIHTHEVSYNLRYPFSDVSRVGTTISYRHDRFVLLSTDVLSLTFPNQYANWGHAQVEYVYDNTLPTALNLYNGTRLKVFGEYFRQVDEKKQNLFIVGFDARNYMKIHREIIWANRLSASKSFGDRKLIYYMGGVDNWLDPSFDRSTPIDYTQNYIYQALASPMRGFDQNIRNGTSFALLNSELRVPIFTYLLNRPIKSDFIRNFQIVGFTDVGTAWNGWSPYDSTNALNNIFISTGPFNIVLQSQHEPIVTGYGFGLRSRILGYFLRADWAWGYQDGEHLPSKFYLSLSLDF